MNISTQLLKAFGSYLSLECGHSANTVEAYTRDIRKLIEYLSIANPQVSLLSIEESHITDFLEYLQHEFSIADTTQARILSSIKQFYSYLIYEKEISKNPAELIAAPKTARKLPDILSYIEIDKILSAIDLSTESGTRDRAMIEVMYSSGLRVSELIDLKISNINSSLQLITIIGKGNKERMVPIGSSALKYLNIYLNTYRRKYEINNYYSDFAFLNQRGKSLSRVYVFRMLKNLAQIAGIQKSISPHTFRHSFATHLIENGADIRAVQEMLGHASITTTEVYTHLDTQYLRHTLEAFHPAFVSSRDN